MLKKMATRALLTVCALLSSVTMPLLAQGVSRQDYTGLDKYLDAGPACRALPLSEYGQPNF